MTRDTKVNGWTNHETSTVSPWLFNESASYHRWREEAREQLRLAEENVDAKTEGWTTRQIAAQALASLIQQSVEAKAPKLEASLYSDLLEAALSQVAWQELAEDFFDDLEPLSQQSSTTKATLPEEF